MGFWMEAVDNSKCRNEKGAQKRQFCDFAPSTMHHFWIGNWINKKNSN
ncbi:hypothetical protein FVB9532_03622 [Mesonia oceanica]|uniref:Uncharacterized protein n=1 Tax=Mesonia oceanica TaxID=2687242 RepID=A0AC61YCU9_9FLAO|nr:hypothetical protein FVB9532_03622 [Mesonia oceanica]|tara:strand:- start:7861 stop:8004 length:144 start_codon:yes stop_codon:yes gene_type:complete